MQTAEVSHSGRDLASLYGSMMLEKQKLERRGDRGELSRKIASFIDMLDRASFEGEFSDTLLKAANNTYQRILELSPSERIRLANKAVQEGNGSLPQYPTQLYFKDFMKSDLMTSIGSLVVYQNGTGKPNVGIIVFVASKAGGVEATVMSEIGGQVCHHPIHQAPYGKPIYVLVPEKHTINGP